MRHEITLSLVWLLDATPPGVVPAPLRRVREGLRAVTARYEILLVTRNVATMGRRVAGADPYVRIIVPERRGDAAALAAGCDAASGDYLLIHIGNEDPQWDALPALLPYLRQGDVTLAVSPAPEPGAENARLVAALGLLYGAMPRDPFGATQLYRAELLRGLTFVSHGPLLRVELLAKARAQGATFTEVERRASLDASEMGNPDSVTAGDSGGIRSMLGYPTVARLWLHLRTFRAPWIVRETPLTLRPFSEYVAGGIVLAAGVWAVRGRFARLRRG